MGKQDRAVEGSWNGSQSVIRASAAKIITFAGSDSFRRPIYYFIRLSVVTQGQAKISLSPLRRKGQRRLIYCFARVTLVFITKWINRSVPRCYDIRRATFDQRGDALVRFVFVDLDRPVHFLQKFLLSKRNARRRSTNRFLFDFDQLVVEEVLFHESNYRSYSHYWS